MLKRAYSSSLCGERFTAKGGAAIFMTIVEVEEFQLPFGRDLRLLIVTFGLLDVLLLLSFHILFTLMNGKLHRLGGRDKESIWPVNKPRTRDYIIVLQSLNTHFVCGVFEALH